MKRIILYSLLTVALFASCHDSEEEILPDNTPTTQSDTFAIQGDTMVIKKLDANEKMASCVFTILRDGDGTSTVTLSPWAEDEVRTYGLQVGKKYKLLPAEAYRMNSNVMDFNKLGIQSKNVAILFRPDKVSQYVNDNPDYKFILPIRLVPSHGTIKGCNTLYMLIDMAPVEKRDIWKFQVKVMLDKTTFVRFYNADIKAVKERLKERFDGVNKLYNGNGKLGTHLFFDSEIVFEPVFDESCVYDESSEDVLRRGAKERGIYPYLIIVDGCIGDFDNERGHQDYTGYWYKNKGSDCTVFYSARDRMKGDAWDILKPYSTSEGFAHELGHGRGVLDLYGMEVEASKNQVNGKRFEAATCIMNMCWGGRQWCEYTRLIINRNKNYTPRMTQYYDMYKLDFPKNVVITVRQNKKVLSDAIVNIYGSAFYSNSLDSIPEYSKRTSDDGIVSFPTTSFYTPRWAGSIDNGVVLIEARYGDAKGYKFLPMYEPQTTWLKGELESHAITIDIK